MKQSLAIPCVAFLAVSFLIPAVAQVTPDTSPSRTTSTAVVNPVNPQAATNTLSSEDRARLYLVRKQYREAEEIFHELTIQDPRNAVYWNELGISFHSQAELVMAMKCYQKAAKLNSQYADALNNQGTIWYERKKYGRAIRVYKKAINLRGDFAPFYLNLGYAYFGQKEFENSISAFHKALQIDPLAFDMSRAHSGTVIQDRSISSDRGHFYFMLAKSFAEAGDLDRCVLYLRKAHDEGYDQMASVKTDPTFAAVLKLPDVQELLAPKTTETAGQPQQP